MNLGLCKAGKISSFLRYKFKSSTTSAKMSSFLSLTLYSLLSISSECLSE